MVLTRAEREMVIRWSEADATATVYTESKSIHRRMVQRGWQPLGPTGVEARTFEVPLAALRLPAKAGTMKALERQPGNPSAFERWRASQARQGAKEGA